MNWEGGMMGDDLKAVLEICWESNPSDDDSDQANCRWCHHPMAGEHDPACPCLALSLALQQRDALASYIKAEKRSFTMQGALRLAKKTAKSQMKQRVDQAALELEAALACLRELGIEELIYK